ncbi:MAG: sulfur carrier protein ThiS, partial [Solirubrobacterales bacterium]|nr:sulfur carrier protein ThiS [Solirubrobacterales bacterium]
VTVNGVVRELPEGSTVAGVVASSSDGPQGRGLAVAVDGAVVPRAQWGQTVLTAGATVELVVAVQGG